MVEGLVKWEDLDGNPRDEGGYLEQKKEKQSSRK